MKTLAMASVGCRVGFGGGLQVALLAVVSLAAACGGTVNGTSTSGTGGSTTASASSTTSAASSTSGASSSTTGAGSTSGGSGTSGATGTTGNGSTTGTSCIAIGQACTPTADNCCGFDAGTAACNPSTFVCGTKTGGTTGGPVNPCLADAGASGDPCLTTYDCNAGLICAAGTCGPPVTDATSCTVDGGAPTAAAPCCEIQGLSGSAAVCTNFKACAFQDATCTTTADCCNQLVCTDGGTCRPTCSGQGSPCGAAGDLPCCAGSGLTCDPSDGGSNVCGFGGLPAQTSDAGGTATSCNGGPVCAVSGLTPETVECQLGAVCNPKLTPDPCAGVGLVCDTTNLTCRQPQDQEVCLPGSGECLAPGDSSVSLSCLPSGLLIDNHNNPIEVCAQACKTTADCENAYAICQPFGFCVTLSTNLCTNYFQTCNAQGTKDGLCVPINNAGQSLIGLCFQGSASGSGGPGTACTVNSNRQIGGLCDTADWCSNGVCSPICNAGTGAQPACGEGEKCVIPFDLGPQSRSADTFGSCVTPCTINGTACAASSAGVPERCMPSEWLNQTYPATPDYCSALAPNPLPVGASCDLNAGGGYYIDPCVDNALCLSTPSGGSVCQQLCTDHEIGQTGVAGGCPEGVTCQALTLTSTLPSIHTGFCPAQPPTTGTTGTTGGTGTGSTTGSSTGGTTSSGTTGGTTTGGTTTGGTTTG